MMILMVLSPRQQQLLEAAQPQQQRPPEQYRRESWAGMPGAAGLGAQGAGADTAPGLRGGAARHHAVIPAPRGDDLVSARHTGRQLQDRRGCEPVPNPVSGKAREKRAAVCVAPGLLSMGCACVVLLGPGAGWTAAGGGSDKVQIVCVDQGGSSETHQKYSVFW